MHAQHAELQILRLERVHSRIKNPVVLLVKNSSCVDRSTHEIPKSTREKADFGVSKSKSRVSRVDTRIDTDEKVCVADTACPAKEGHFFVSTFFGETIFVWTRRVHAKNQPDTRIFDFDTPKSGFSCVDLRILRVDRISPLGVVPQRDRRPRLIVDYSFSNFNEETVPLAPIEFMQFGRALQRIMAKIVRADPQYGRCGMPKSISRTVSTTSGSRSRSYRNWVWCCPPLLSNPF